VCKLSARDQTLVAPKKIPPAGNTHPPKKIMTLDTALAVAVFTSLGNVIPILVPSHSLPPRGYHPGGAYHNDELWFVTSMRF